MTALKSRIAPQQNTLTNNLIVGNDFLQIKKRIIVLLLVLLSFEFLTAIDIQSAKGSEKIGGWFGEN